MSDTGAGDDGRDSPTYECIGSALYCEDRHGIACLRFNERLRSEGYVKYESTPDGMVTTFVDPVE